jgi:hypothetical protein
MKLDTSQATCTVPLTSIAPPPETHELAVLCKLYYYATPQLRICCTSFHQPELLSRVTSVYRLHIHRKYSGSAG